MPTPLICDPRAAAEGFLSETEFERQAIDRATEAAIAWEELVERARHQGKANLTEEFECARARLQLTAMHRDVVAKAFERLSSAAYLLHQLGVKVDITVDYDNAKQPEEIMGLIFSLAETIGASTKLDRPLVSPTLESQPPVSAGSRKKNPPEGALSTEL